MSSRTKRKLEAFDPNASDPNDSDFDAAERPSPQRRRNRNRKRPAGGGSRKGNKRARRSYNGSDVDDDEDDVEFDDSFTDRSSSEEIEINPTTGRSVRRAAQKKIKYEESDEDAEAIEDTPSEDEGESPAPRRNRRERREPSEAKPQTKSLIVRLNVGKAYFAGTMGRSTRAASKTVTRGKTPEVGITRRSSRLSHDVEQPIVALSDSGRHVNIVRPGTRSPEPVVARATRGGKGPRTQQPSAIIEASQETSMAREDDSPGPLDQILAGGDDAQVKASREVSPEQEAQQVQKDEHAEEGDMEGVIQESQHGPASEESEDEGPITRGGRNLRVGVVPFVLVSWLANFCSLAASQPSENVVQTKAATLNRRPMTKRKRRQCPLQTTPRVGGLPPRIVAQAQVDVHLASRRRHDNRNEADAAMTALIKIPYWTQTN
jgi:hypothetical protein